MMDDIIEVVRKERIDREEHARIVQEAEKVEREKKERIIQLEKEWDWPETEFGYYKPKCETPYRLLKLKKDEIPVMMNREHIRIPSPDLFKG